MLWSCHAVTEGDGDTFPAHSVICNVQPRTKSAAQVPLSWLMIMRLPSRPTACMWNMKFISMSRMAGVHAEVVVNTSSLSGVATPCRCVMSVSLVSLGMSGPRCLAIRARLEWPWVLTTSSANVRHIAARPCIVRSMVLRLSCDHPRMRT